MVNKNTLRIGGQFLFFGIASAIIFVAIAAIFNISLNIFSYFLYSLISLVSLIGIILIITGLAQNN